jgi:hypothetical protein
MDDVEIYPHKLSDQSSVRYVNLSPAHNATAELQGHLQEMSPEYPGISKEQVKQYPPLAKLRFKAMPHYPHLNLVYINIYKTRQSQYII